MKKIIKTIMLALVLTGLLIFSGCSSDKPVIREVEIQNKKLDRDTFTYDIVVKVAVDESPEKATTFVVKLSSLTDSTYSREKEGGLMEGMFNSNVVFNQKYTEYEGQELSYNLELIQGTEVLDSQIVKFKYEE